MNLEKIVKIDLKDKKIYSDSLRLNIIFSNIISNAIKYQNFEAERSYLKINIEVESDQVHIQFKDNGQGIGEKHISKIFDMFYRATTRSEGSGLGLYIVKQTVERLSGKIELTSKLNKGTEIKITLPTRL